jgi:glycosyltransferase involved in cell wall biosynthesis
LLPHLAFFLGSIHSKTVLTVHEFKRANPLRKWAIIPLMECADRIIFTNEGDASSASKYYPGLQSKSEIIPIGSNIPVTPRERRSAQENIKIIFFGLLRPNRGLEDFLDFAGKLSKLNQSVEFGIIGHALSSYANYVEGIQKTSRGIPVTWHISQSPEQISWLLSRADIAYLPIPGGVEGRNGTVLAALTAGLPIMAPCNRDTEEGLKECIIQVANAEDAVNRILTLMPQILEGAINPEFTQYLASRSWPDIAQKHYLRYRIID